MNRLHIQPARWAAALALGVSLSVLLPAMALAETWNVDPGHSSAQFTVVHLMISRIVGTIPIKSATVVTPTGSDIPSSVEATLDVANLDSKNERRDSDLRSPNFFDVTKYPTIQFKSRSISKGAGNNFTMQGDLTIHGVTKPVTIACEYLASITDNRGRKHNGYTAALKIKRDDYGMTYDAPVAGPLIAGHDVQIDIQIEAVAPS